MPPQVARSLTRIAGLVAIATALSKIMGLGRQLLIADIYGSGAAYSSHNIAYILPGFLLILLGGLNGPFHSATVSILKKRQGESPSVVVETLSTLSGLVLAVVAAAIAVFAYPIVFALAPGVSEEVHQLAAYQLRIMAPLAILAGQIGIGFGALNAFDHYLLPSISPLLTSSMVILALVLFGDPSDPTILAWAVLAGGILQWVTQLVLLYRKKLTKLRLRFDWKAPGVQAAIALVIPAIISSGTIHINVYTDIFFASFVPGDGTISNLAYAQLLYLTPLGILSNAILVPLMPYFASLAVPDKYPEFRAQVRQGLVVTALSILPFALFLGVLSRPIVQLVYQRGAFDAEATMQVAALLTAYAIGMLFYLGRDVLVRVFYALEDSVTPLTVSTVAIVLNGVFDWLGIRWLGAPGLPISTAGVNLVGMVWLAIALNGRVGHWPWKKTVWDIGRLLGVAALAGGSTWFVYGALAQSWGAVGFVAIVLKVAIASGVGLMIYCVGSIFLGLPEVAMVSERLLALVGRFLPKG